MVVKPNTSGVWQFEATRQYEIAKFLKVLDDNKAMLLAVVRKEATPQLRDSWIITYFHTQELGMEVKT